MEQLSWIVRDKVRPGMEDRFLALCAEGEDLLGVIQTSDRDMPDIQGMMARYEDLLRKCSGLMITPLRSIKCPRIGIEHEATTWALENVYEPSKEAGIDVPLDRFISKWTGEPVSELAKVPTEALGTIQGDANAPTFGVGFFCSETSHNFFGPSGHSHLLGMLFEEGKWLRSSEEAVELGDGLLKAADALAKAMNVESVATIREELVLANPESEAALRMFKFQSRTLSLSEIFLLAMYDAARFAKFWGELGHGLQTVGPPVRAEVQEVKCHH